MIPLALSLLSAWRAYAECFADNDRGSSSLLFVGSAVGAKLVVELHVVVHFADRRVGLAPTMKLLSHVLLESCPTPPLPPRSIDAPLAKSPSTMSSSKEFFDILVSFEQRSLHQYLPNLSDRRPPSTHIRMAFSPRNNKWMACTRYA